MTSGRDPKRWSTIWRSAQQPADWVFEQFGHAAVRPVVVQPLVVSVETVVDGPDPFGADRGVGATGPGRQFGRGGTLLRVESSAADKPAKGASPRSTRSRLSTTNSCSGTVNCAKPAGRSIGPSPSPARAASMAASVRRMQVFDESSPTGAQELG